MPENNNTIASQFVGLPLGLLVCQPIMEVAKGQAALCQVYLDNLFALAFQSDEKTGELKAKTVKFTLNRMVVNNGDQKTVPIQVEAPLLSLVPVPAFTMDETTVRFTMEVRDQSVDKNSTSANVTTSAGYSGWGFKASISGSVTTQGEHTRTTDKSAKYEIYARACQQPPAEGMAKLTSIVASVIEPVDVSGGGKDG